MPVERKGDSDGWGQNTESTQDDSRPAGRERSAGRPDRRPADLVAAHQQGAGTGQRLPDDIAGSAAVADRRLVEGRTPRPDVDGGLPSAREDHALRSRADPRARGARPRHRGARRVRVVRHRRRHHLGRLPAARPGHPGVHPLLDRGRLTRFGRHGARCPWVRGQVLHRRGRVRSRRQQHPGVLHP